MKRRFALALAVLCAVPRASYAQDRTSPPSDAARAEAAERFDRGLRLFNGGDSAGALAEFRRAYGLIPNSLVLYNIGLVYAQMGRAVEAADALERVLANPAALSAERIAVARRTHDEQAARIAEIAIATNVDGAAVEIDGVEAGKLPLERPLRVTGGTHVIGAVAPGFVPLRKEVTIASGERQALQLDLVAMQGRLAHLVVKTHLPGADVFADGQRIGTTPLAASVSLSPGPHGVELRRAGYATAHADIVLDDGANGEVSLEPSEDADSMALNGGSLVLDIDETQAVVTVDGRARGVYAAPLRLVPGVHHLLVERGEFEPWQRDFTIDSGHTTSIRAALDPTPEYRARYVSHAKSQRTWSLVSVIAGALVAGAGTALVIYDAKQRGDGRSTLASLQAQSTHGSGQVCDSGQEASVYQQNCLVPIAAANAKIADANTRDDFGWTAVALGGAGVALGVVLFATADDVHRYDRRDTVGDRRPRLTPTFWVTRGGGGASLAGTF
jgi:hypothetical protein